MRISHWSSDVCSSDLVIAFVPLEEVADTGGKLRPEACSALDGIRELGRMCSGERHHRDRRIDVAEASGGKSDRSVRINKLARGIIGPSHCDRPVIPVTSRAGKKLYRASALRVGEAHSAIGFDTLHLLSSAERRVGKKCVST